MKLLVEIRSSAEVDIDLRCHKSTDEVEKVIKDYLTWGISVEQVRALISKAEIYLPAAERGDVIKELEKNNA